MAPSKFKSHAEHVGFSEKIKSDINKTGQDLLQKIIGMDRETANHLLIILNDTIKSIFTLTCELQEIIIKSNEEELSNSDLKVVVKKLSQDCNELVQGYENDRTKLHNAFEKFIQNILHEAEGLFNVIKKDDLHAHKHELVEVLKEILCIMHRIQMRIRIENCSLQEVLQIVEDIKLQFAHNVSNLDSSDPKSLKHVRTHLQHTSRHAFDLGYHLYKVASNYDDEIQHKLLEVANLFIIALAEKMLGDANNINHEYNSDSLNKYSNSLWKALENLLGYIENQLEHKKSSNNLKDVVTHIFSYGMVNCQETGRSIKHDSMMKLR